MTPTKRLKSTRTLLVIDWPERAALIYAYRSITELSSIIETAKRLNAKETWTQSGMSAEGVRDPKGCWVSEREEHVARNLVRSAGLSTERNPTSPK